MCRRRRSSLQAALGFEQLQRLAILFEVRQVVGPLPNVVRLQKSVQFIPSLEPEQTANLIGSESTAAVAFDGHSFERSARRVLPLRSQNPSDIIGDFHCDLHCSSVADSMGGSP